MLEHGGRLIEASKKQSIPLSQWVDLSTGINPNGWPVPILDDAAWNRLPEEEDGLMEAASHYYGCDDLLAVAGSQAAIQLLPQLRKPCRVAIVSPCYAEHQQAWQKAGHQLQLVSSGELEERIDQFDVVVIVNPNNPTGRLETAERLKCWHHLLSCRGGWLVVDEAFMDAIEGYSLISRSVPRGLFILRSVGKFFGLAGARVGFLAAEHSFLKAAAEQLGPWVISGPSRAVVQSALKDRVWQLDNRALLLEKSERLKLLLAQYVLPTSGGTALFQYIKTSQAETIYNYLLADGILVRLFQQPMAVRFGLPKDEKAWQLLERSLFMLVQARGQSKSANE